MEPNTALELVKKGATFLALDVPQYTLFGIDTQMFSAGPNFKGIKMIPPGIHFIYYSSSNREGNEFSPIVGFFIHASSSQVIVRRWDQKEEWLVKVSEEEEERYSDAVKRLEFDKQLGPYTLSQYGDWTHLSNYITKDTVDRLEPIGGKITIACESEVVEMFSKTSTEKSLAEHLTNNKFSSRDDKSQKRRCYYTAIPRVVKQKGISGEDLTSLNLDKTYLLETILMKEYGGDEEALLAELQFAFIAFLMGQSLEAFLQWKLLVSLLLGCTESPLHSRSRLFTKFVKALYYQLKIGFQKDTGDITRGVADQSWLSSDSFLHRLCKDFFSVVLEAPVVDGDLLTW
ncbi:AAR2 protein family, partial [Perilla frutescens var. frutescens]